jgi:tetratricopeptide (TPR) repeat protein
MRKPLIGILALIVIGAVPLAAQQPCPGLTVVVNSPEDAMMLAVNGADNPQDQVAALDKYAAAHADAPAMTCVNELYTAAYLKTNDFAKAIASGEKDLAANYLSGNLAINLAKAYVGAGQATDSAFALIAKAPDAIKAEANPPRPSTTSDAEWQSNLQAWAANAAQQRAYMEYAFFQLLARVPDASKRVQYLDAFAKAYADSPNLGGVYAQYVVAYTGLNNAAKADEYGEKAVAASPNDVATLNLVADNYATREAHLDKAEADAKKALELVPAMKKPDGVSDADFQAQQNLQLAAAHLTLGYVAFQHGSATHRVTGAIQELKTASSLAQGNPALQARALFYMGYAYEELSPPNHHAAAEALTQAASLQSPWQAQAQALLAKIPKK